MGDGLHNVTMRLYRVEDSHSPSVIGRADDSSLPEGAEMGSNGVVRTGGASPSPTENDLNCADFGGPSRTPVPTTEIVRVAMGL